jgi:hypothetical protein
MVSVGMEEWSGCSSGRDKQCTERARRWGSAMFLYRGERERDRARTSRELRARAVRAAPPGGVGVRHPT